MSHQSRESPLSAFFCRTPSFSCCLISLALLTLSWLCLSRTSSKFGSNFLRLTNAIVKVVKTPKNTIGKAAHLAAILRFKHIKGTIFHGDMLLAEGIVIDQSTSFSLSELSTRTAILSKK